MITYPLLGVRGVDFVNGATETYQKTNSELKDREKVLARSQKQR